MFDEQTLQQKTMELVVIERGYEGITDMKKLDNGTHTSSKKYLSCNIR